MPLTLKSASAIASALAIIGGTVVGAVAFARPYLQSDPPPLAGQTRVQQEDTKIVQLAQTQQQMQQQQSQQEQTLLFLAQGFWSGQLIQAEALLRQNPNNTAARQQMLTAQQALAGIQSRLYGAPVPGVSP